MLEVRTAGAVPQFPAVLLMGPPVAFDREGLPALAAHERLGAVLPLVVGLEGPEIFERLGSWVVDVVLTALRTAVAWQPKHRCWLCALQRVWALSIFRSVSPHMHLWLKGCFNDLEKQIYVLLWIHDIKLEIKIFEIVKE